MIYTLDTTGSAPAGGIPLQDLGIRANVPKPSTGYDLSAKGLTPTEIQASAQLASALSSGYVILYADGQSLSEVDSIPNSQLGVMAANTIKGNNTGSPAVPLDLTSTQAKTLMSLENVSNTSDANKPVSTATQSALDLKLQKIAKRLTVQKVPGAGEFSSIKTAVDSITDNSVSNPYLVFVGPGVFTEDTITLKPYVYILGSGDQVTVITVDTPTKKVIIGSDSSGIENCQITGATGTGGVGIYHEGSGTLFPFLVRNCFLANNETQAKAHGATLTTILQLDGIRMGGTTNCTTGFSVTNVGAVATQLALTNTIFQDVVGGVPTQLGYASGTGVSLIISDLLARIAPTAGAKGLVVESGAELRVLSATLRGFDTAIQAPNTGAATKLVLQGMNVEDSITWDIQVLHPSATGNFFGKYTATKLSINESSTFYVANKDLKIVTVGKAGADFSSIAAAVDSITDASASRPYVVFVGPGIFTEPEIVLKDYISVVGHAVLTTIVQPDAATHHVFSMALETELSFLSVRNAGSGFAGVASEDVGDFTQLHKVSITDCDIGILVSSATQDCYSYLEYVDINGVYTNAVKVVSGGFVASVNLENFYTFPDAANAGNQILIDGADAEVNIEAASLEGSTLDTGVYLTNAASLNARDVTLRLFDSAIEVDPLSASVLTLSSILFIGNTLNLNVNSPTASGSFSGYSDHSKNVINDASSFFITQKDTQIITVAKKGGDYASIAEAINDITDSSASKPYLIQVGPGVFTEPLINLTAKPYISITGTSISNTIIEPDGVSHHIIDLGVFNDISNLTLRNAGSGFAAIRMLNQGGATADHQYSRLHRVDIHNSDTGVFLRCTNPAKDQMLYGEFLNIFGTYTTGIKIENAGGICTCAILVHLNMVPDAGVTCTDVSSTGSGAGLEVHACMMDGNTLNTAFVVENASYADISATIIDNAAVGISFPNTGSAPTMNSNGLTINSTTTVHMQIDHPTAVVTFNGTADQSKISNSSSNFAFVYLDPSTKQLEISNQLNMTFTDGTHTDLSTILIESGTMGVYEGGVLSDGGGFVVDVSAGFGYKETVSEILVRQDWSADSITLAANQERYIYYNTSGILSAGGTAPDSTINILLGRVVTNASGIEFIENSPVNADHASNRYSKLFRKATGVIYSSGSVVSENATALHLDVSAGVFFLGTKEFMPSGGTDISFREFYRDGSGGWTRSSVSAVAIKYDNSSGTLQNPPTGDYVKHSLYVIGEGVEEKYFLVIGQETFNNLPSAQIGSIPLPPGYFSDGVALIANIIVQEGFANIVEIQDARPRVSFRATGSTAPTSHGDLLNLNVDDHLGYLRVDGGRALTGNLDLGGNNVTNVNLVDGIDVTAHAARHLPNGADALTTAAPSSNLNGGSINAVGIASSLARSDHSHGVDTATTSIAGFMSAADKTKLDGFSGARPVKSGVVLAGSFAGNPKKATVTFGTAYASTAYAVSITGVDSRAWSYETKSASSFVINSNANTALTGEVSWTCIFNGESLL